MRKKYIITAAAAAGLLLLAAALFLLLREAPETPPSLQQITEEKLSAYETDLKDSLGSMKTNEDVGNYLLTWAKNKQITAVSDAGGNIVYSIPPSEAAPAEAQPAAVICSFDASDMETHLEEIAAALTIAKNAENTGHLQVIFLAENQEEKIGAKALAAGYFAENTAVFCLGAAASEQISAVTGGCRHIQISSKLHDAEPAYSRAYKIQLKNCPSLSISETYEAGLNPIKTLGGVLANLQSTSLLFELSDFRGGSGEMITPSEASIILVINEEDAARFEKKIDGFIRKFYEKYGETYPEIEYTYEAVSLPKRVISDEDTDNLVSLMYTAFNGIYNRNEEGTITALTNMGSIRTENGLLKIDTAILCSDPQLMEELSETYETICGLCDVNYEVKENIPGYIGSEMEQTQVLLTGFREAYSQFTGKRDMAEEETAVLTACSWIHEKNPEIAMIFCGITSESKYSITGSVLTWLNQNTEETEA